MTDPTSDLIAQIDIEIEACERAIRKAYSVQEVDALSIRVQELIKKRFVVYNSNPPEQIQEELVRWMTEGTDPDMSPRSDCG